MSRVIDVHTHYFPSTLVAALESRSDQPKITQGPDSRLIHYGEGNIHPLQEDMLDISIQLRDMDRQGIDFAVISANIPGCDWFPPEDGAVVARDVNDELADVVRAHPDRLAALAALPMQNPQAAAAEIERIHGKGFAGAMIYSNVAGRQIDEPEFQVVFDTAGHLGVPIYLHPTYPLSAKTVDAYALIPTIGFLMDTTSATLRLVLGGLYDRHPDFKLVVSHVASLIPYFVGRIDYEAERHGEKGLGALYGKVKPSEHLRLIYTDVVCDWPPTVKMVTDLLGPDRVMFGSDYPFWDPERSFKALEQSGINGADAEKIRSGTAEKLFNLGS